jgi:outer membrane protein assembly factor BamA
VKPFCQIAFILFFFFVSGEQLLLGQVNKVFIKAISYEGLKKTKIQAVKSYLNIKEGDSISLEDLLPKLEENQRNVLNSKLFSRAELKILEWQEESVCIHLKVVEAWYVFPIPIFELADRNINVWWKDFNRDISRVNSGIAVYWRNLAGYNDRLTFIAQFGFTRKFEIDYELPPIDKKQRFGISLNVLYSDNKESIYNSIDNKLIFYRNLASRERQFSRFRSGLTLRYRKSVYSNHYFECYFQKLGISDSIYFRNPDFFLDGRKTQRAFTFNYEYKLDKRDIWTYPLDGHMISLYLNKRGFGLSKDINQLWLGTRLASYNKFGKRWSLGLLSEGRYSVFKHKDPFYQQDALGYGDSFVRGYQYYVVNGQSYFLFRSDLNFKILDLKVALNGKENSPFLHEVPFRIHTRLHADYGYVWDKYYYYGNKLNNAHMYSGGLGLDFAFYNYNILIQIEYTVNRLLQKDVYLTVKANF